MLEGLRNYIRGLAKGGRVAIARRVVVGGAVVLGIAFVVTAIGAAATGETAAAVTFGIDAAVSFGSVIAFEMMRTSRYYMVNRNAGLDNHDAVVRAEEQQQVQVQPAPRDGQFHGVGVGAGNQTQQKRARVARTVQVVPFSPTQDTANPLAEQGVGEEKLVGAGDGGAEEVRIPISAAATGTPEKAFSAIRGAARVKPATTETEQENPF